VSSHFPVKGRGGEIFGSLTLGGFEELDGVGLDGGGGREGVGCLGGGGGSFNACASNASCL